MQVAVVDGYAFPHQTKRLNVAGRHVTAHLLELLQRRGYHLNRTADLDTVGAWVCIGRSVLARTGWWVCISRSVLARTGWWVCIGRSVPARTGWWVCISRSVFATTGWWVCTTACVVVLMVSAPGECQLTAVNAVRHCLLSL